MARQKSPNRDKAFEIYKEHKGNIMLIDIAKQLDVSDVQIRKWKSQDKWDDILKGTLPMKSNIIKSNVTNEKVTKKNKKEVSGDQVEAVLKNSELTDKQKLFCIYYSKCFNQLKAYQKAYECSYEVAGKNAYRLMDNEGIKKQIDQLTQITMNKEILKRGLLQKYIDIAFSDIKDYMTFGTETIETEKGEFEVSVVKLKDSSNVDGSLITEVSQGKDGIKIKLADKMKALDFLTKHCNLLNDEEKTKLDIEYKKLQNKNLQTDIDRKTGNNVEIEDTEELEGEIYGNS